jgi:pimeloyl-ACP methyl ester carboxylesterase
MLGQTEWHDVDAALDYAVAHGAQNFILVGWSMGAMIALQLTRSSRHRERIAGLCLIAPVVDWRSSILAAGRRARVPAFVTHLAMRVLGSPLSRRATGLQEPIGLSNLDWITNGADLNVPTLVLHSSGDRSVPIAMSRAFSDAHKELVELVELPAAPHTLEWNRSPELWETTFSGWLGSGQ